MAGYADDTTIYAVIPRPILRPQVMKSLNQYIAAIHSKCLMWHRRLNPKKTKSMVVIRSRPYAPGYKDLLLVVLSLRRWEVGIFLRYPSTRNWRLRLVCVKLHRRQPGVCGVRRTRKLFDCPRVLKSGFNAYVLSNAENWAPAWMSSAECYLSCVCSIRLITEWTTLCMSICTISLQLVILELQLL